MKPHEHDDLARLTNKPLHLLRKDEGALTRLAGWVDCADSALRDASIEMLEQVVRRPPPRPWLESNLERFCTWLLRNSEARVRTLAARFVGQVDLDEVEPDTTRRVARALLDSLSDPDPEVVRSSRRALGPENLPEVLTDNLTQLFSSPLEEARLAAVELLYERVDDERVRCGYQRMLVDDVREVRRRAAFRMGLARSGTTLRIEVPSACFDLWVLDLEAPEPSIRVEAVTALSHCPRTDCIERLKQVARTDPKPEVRTEALVALARTGVDADSLWDLAIATINAWTPDHIQNWNLIHEVSSGVDILERHDPSRERVSKVLLQHLDTHGVFSSPSVVEALARLRVADAAARFVSIVQSRTEAGKGFDPITGLACAYCGNETTGAAIERIDELGFVPVEAVDTWIDVLQDADSEVLHPSAAVALARMAPGLERARSAIIQSMLKDKLRFASRTVPALAICGRWDRAALLALLRVLQEGDPEFERKVCRDALRRYVARDPEGIAALRALSNEGIQMASEALAIAGVPTPDGLAQLVRQLDSKDMRCEAVEVLRRWSGSAAERNAELLEVVGNENADTATRGAALDVLSACNPDIGSNFAKGIAIASMASDPVLRQHAARTALDGDAQARLPIVQRLMNDPDQAVRDVAACVYAGICNDSIKHGPGSTASLAFKMLAEWPQLAPEQNVVFSPPSILAVLWLAQLGARGATGTELAQWLGRRPLEPGELRAWFQRLPADEPEWTESSLLDGVNEGRRARSKRPSATRFESKDFRWRSVTALFVQRGLTLCDEFLRELHSLGGESLVEVDFRTTDSGRIMGQWVSRMIEGRLDPGALAVDSRTTWSLLNSAFLSAKWMAPFTKGTHMEAFYRLDGSVVETAMMHELVDAPALFDREFQAIELLYRPGRASMVVVVPRSGYFDRVRRGMCVGFWTDVLKSMSPLSLSLSMPKFRIRSKPPVRRWLEHGNVQSLFAAPDMTGISPTLEDGAFGELEHVAQISVNEEGTEAAAYTAMFHMGSASTPLAIDRPFLFAVRDRESGEVLFAGQVVDPA